ncbi:MAG: apolipoprotein N-acyltransferase [Burkholderiaceae bacterium]
MIVLRLPAGFPLRPLLALMLGALHAASFRSDTGWPVEIAVLAGLFVLAQERADWRGSSVLGFSFGLGWFVTGIYWIYISIHTYGQVAAPLAALATLLLSAYLALYPALACGIAAYWNERAGSRLGFFWVIGPLWMLAEMARATFLTGFPWLATGYAHVGGPLAGYAPLVGVHGITLIAAAMAAALATLARNRPPRAGAVRLVLIVTLLGFPLAGLGLAHVTWSHPVGEPLRVRLLQGDIAQDVKFEPEHFDSTVATYLRLLESHPADLIVLPETAIPIFLNDVPDALVERLRDDARRLHAAIAFGVPIADGPLIYTNSVLALSPDNPSVQRYDKTHLVPFGEFVPTGFHWFVEMMHIPLGDFTAGSLAQAPLNLADRKVAFNICYEDLFGEVIRRQAAAANVLVNVSNVAWFGDSQALPQHLQLSRMRALETARPMLRATNTGMTADIDPHGQVQALLPAYTSASLDISVQPMTGTTPYVAFGDVPSLVAGLLMLLWAACSGFRIGRFRAAVSNKR